ncbi:ribosomal protein S18-alanine N-acetyltransferase [Fusobacterium sp.]|uniref:ribosomal protein S18-alanine N-acetyltransferase n=1 Tax=Fusobacterium sp. TaxID=68766 RepID=UPI002628F9B1|nr:ribosomal protein S18-alanine N-acetyltransferase [Fusobacterium sp.]
MRLEYEIDIESLTRLEKICFPTSAYTEEQLSEMVQDKERYSVIGVSSIENLVGYVIVFDNSESLEIMKIAVLPEFRKKGIGKILLDEIEKLKKDIFLEVRESNIVAREFYIKNSFKEIGKRKNYYKDNNEAAIIMLKENNKN